MPSRITIAQCTLANGHTSVPISEASTTKITFQRQHYIFVAITDNIAIPRSNIVGVCTIQPVHIPILCVVISSCLNNQLRAYCQCYLFSRRLLEGAEWVVPTLLTIPPNISVGRRWHSQFQALLCRELRSGSFDVTSTQPQSRQWFWDCATVM